jgi:multiple sugar transport system permease protein
LAFIAPNLASVLVFLLFPLLFSLFISFTSWDLFSAPVPVGLRNYIRLLTADPLFWTAVRNTVAFVVLTIVPSILLSLLLAALLKEKLGGLGLFRTALFLPVVSSTVAVSVIWRWIFTSDGGFLNWLISLVGIAPVGWLTDEHWALVSVAIASVWKSVGLSTVILLAAMQGVPDVLYEAALIDGAGPWRRFRSITIPLIVPTISFVVVILTINSFQVFDQVYVLTGGAGGPGTSTYVYGLMLFQNAFRFFNMGYASAMAWLLFLALIVLTFIQLRLTRRATEGIY